MKVSWNQRHGAIFTALTIKLKEKNIKYFVLRNYEGLPERNLSKDVDMIIELGYLKEARELLLQTYREAGLRHYYEVVFGRVHCLLGMNEFETFSIHIDLIEGYLAKGFEIFTFNELYRHTKWYRGFCVMDTFYEGVMLYIYKQFGYRNPKLKTEYTDRIVEIYQAYPAEFFHILLELTDKTFASRTCRAIEEKRFDDVLRMSSELTKALRRYVWRKRPISTIKNTLIFMNQKFGRIVAGYKKYKKTFAVIAPDGAGKTTFLDTLSELASFYYVNDINDKRFHVYHFRPEILPNLGQVGEKAGVMKQNTDFTSPHRSKPANPLSSLIRIAYYTLDYIVGWQKCVRKDVQYDRYTVFDRYCYDFIVDPHRTKLNLPECVRKFFVAMIPKPDVVFYLDAAPEVIFSRKQELTLEEIQRQVGAYRKLANSDTQRFKIINAEHTPDVMAEEAVHILLERFTERL